MSGPHITLRKTASELGCHMEADGGGGGEEKKRNGEGEGDAEIDRKG